MKKHLYTAIAILAFFAKAFAQPANDNCSTATSIGSLPTPVACPTGTGATVTYTGTTVAGTASSPYPYMVGCSTGGSQQSPGIDVWYSFVATGTDLHLTLNSSFASPNVGLWSGSCASLSGVDCMKGSAGGVLTYTNVSMTPGQTYLIQKSNPDREPRMEQ